MPNFEPSDPQPSQQFHWCRIADADRVNREILQAYLGLTEGDFSRRTHHLGGRYENLYVERSGFPAVEPVLARATDCAARILGLPAERLHCGFWFNDMGPGQGTSRHTHAELDELLSGVYYVEVPEESGELLLFDRRMRTQVEPEAGMFVFFRPEVPHEVSVNRSDRHRLSIGMNFGPVEKE